MEDILIPIGICVVLPITIAWLVNRTKQNEINRKTEVMLKAIEAGVPIDANAFNSNGKTKSLKWSLLKRLTGGCIFSLMGILFTTFGLISKSMLTENVSNDSFIFPCLFGGLFLAIGVALLVTFFVGKNMLAKEIETEEKALEEK